MTRTEPGTAPRAGGGLDRETIVFLTFIAALTILRLVGQHFSVVDLDIERRSTGTGRGTWPSAISPSRR
jgi:hypothetical protein